MPQVFVRDLRKNYGRLEAVRGVSFQAEKGRVFGLLGPNGAGKTSTIECVLGLRRPDGGTIEICGIDALTQPDRVKQIVGAQLQTTSLQDKITPREALRLFGSFFERPASPAELLNRFSLKDKADAPFDSLSGGQRQRLGLALAFVNRPQVLLLDEPTSGLDPQSRRELHASIFQLREEGHTVLLTTHYIHEAQLLCDQIAIIDRGIIVAAGTPDELVDRSAALPRVVFRTARLIDGGCVRQLPGVSGLHMDGGQWTVRTHAVSKTIGQLMRTIEQDQNELLDLQIVRPTLEDVFIELTGADLRE